jgi:hypothetical protein
VPVAVASTRRWFAALPRAVRRCAAAVVAVGLLTAACADHDGPAGPAWGREAEAWIAAYDAAAGAGYGDGPAGASAFYAADVTVVTTGTTEAERHGRIAVTELDRSIAATASRREAGETYLDTGGFLRTEAVEWREPGRVPSLSATVREVGADGIVAVEHLNWLQAGVVRDNPAFDGARDRAVALAAEHVRAWTQADFAALRELYAPGASLTDSLLGVRVDGREAIVALADPRTAVPARPARARDVHDPRVLAATGADPDAPAVYVGWPYLRPDEPGPARVLLLERGAEPCPGASAVLLTLDEAGRVLAERRWRAVRSVRACLAARALEEGWWSGRELPVPLGDRVTGHVDSPSGRVEVRNGTPELEVFVRWGLGRFSAADLPPPRVARIAFDPFASRCADFGGYTEAGPGATAIVICADASGTARLRRADVTCPGSECPTASVTWRALLLHELGHAWLVTRASAEARKRFTEHVGQSAWADEAVPRQARAVEQAASTLAWGLADGPTPAPGGGPRTCASLAEGFRLLTGREPLATCARPPARPPVGHSGAEVSSGTG